MKDFTKIMNATYCSRLCIRQMKRNHQPKVRANSFLKHRQIDLELVIESRSVAIIPAIVKGG